MSAILWCIKRGEKVRSSPGPLKHVFVLDGVLLFVVHSRLFRSLFQTSAKGHTEIAVDAEGGWIYWGQHMGTGTYHNKNGIYRAARPSRKTALQLRRKNSTYVIDAT